MTAVATWPGRVETWLDEHGEGAWIAAMVIGFIAFWPIGLAILAYMIWGKKIWGKKMSGKSCAARSHSFRTSGNRAFDAYKAETLKRLEDEQEAFAAFLERLREAKDKTEFDAFMDERARRRAEEAGGSRSAD